ncbi:hypothetical protein IV417_15565 [Alphaproteobacteria bacterium KMM 3653]|uniref:C-type lysozyme inhibitor domain-containing protein n=1 Tax=Harenicola maris TaxID=2841044 RepID=A0AAP2CQR8_9RHOB|nr:hypothetical protein [Harenicola maris]
MRLPLIIFACLMPAAAFAQCGSGEQTVLHCTVSNGAKTLQVCSGKETLHYAYGATGQSPDLALAVPFTHNGYVPWAGVGRAIHEAVVFTNGEYSYEAWSSIERGADLADPVTGGVFVLKDGESVAGLDCDQGSITTDFNGLYEALNEAGLCWNQSGEFKWTACQ